MLKWFGINGKSNNSYSNKSEFTTIPEETDLLPNLKKNYDTFVHYDLFSLKAVVNFKLKYQMCL